MIIVRIDGGLGNQMFQYAAAKATALRLGADLLLDAGFNRHSERIGRIFMLKLFQNITEKEASTADVIKLFPALGVCDGIKGMSSSLPRRVLARIFRHIFYGLGMMPECGARAKEHSFPLRFSKVYFQRGSEYYADSIPDNIYMLGNWESEKFFDGIKTQIRSAYSFDASFYDSPLYRQLSLEQSVSIHVRRGDKVNHKRLFPSDLNFIVSAVRVMLSKLSDPVFYVFSDDISWCKKNLPCMLNMPLNFVENHEIKDAFKDMFFMSQCKHNIIGPSTFSWWAAWLNPNPNKIVIAPHQNLWTSSKRGGVNLLPQEWLVLK